MISLRECKSSYFVEKTSKITLVNWILGVKKKKETPFDVSFFLNQSFKLIYFLSGIRNLSPWSSTIKRSVRSSYPGCFTFGSR